MTLAVRPDKARSAIAAIAFGVAAALTVARHLWAPLFLDFGSGIYYPARAFLDGANPYDAAAYLAATPATRRSHMPLTCS